LTAHHAEDQAETLLLQALRGAGVKGLSAMPPCRPLGRGWHLRPLLEVPQAALLALAAHAGAAAVLDPMNQDLRFDRSYLRRQVWPLIESRWPGSAAALTRTARHAAEAQEMLDAAAAVQVSRLRDGDALSVPGLRALKAGERINVLRYWLCESGVEPPSTARLTEALRQILDAQLDHMPAIPWCHCALRRYRQRILITAAERPQRDGARRWRVGGDSRVELGPQLGSLRWAAQIGGLIRSICRNS
jgi:tRNA(Ile)-lysidine synthase